ncbi:MAG: LytTR family transcriptional regulator DNA-binding domain-containing protein [Muribaculaceae bacterium]|nr:LytTR family transcriptional regulator DNA-binding domain-containing protein [Muribaculaceae bacterium]
MPNICLNSRDELLLIDIEKIAFLQANGNYTRLTYIGGQSMMLTMGLSKVEDMLRAAHPKNRPGLYVRLGRSLIINQAYLSSISMCKQKIVLSDRERNSYSLSVPKELLKVYKNKISDTFASMNK